jgi:hypothetical protein
VIGLHLTLSLDMNTIGRADGKVRIG